MKEIFYNIDFCLISFILFLVFLYMINYENFIETVDDDISYNVIHIKKDNELRYNQILEMENKIGDGVP